MGLEKLGAYHGLLVTSELRLKNMFVPSVCVCWENDGRVQYVLKLPLLTNNNTIAVDILHILNAQA